MVLTQFAIVTGFVIVHLFAGKLRFLDGIPRSSWLSLAGGISVAYVFMHVFPELAEAQHSIGDSFQILSWVDNHAYLVALSGLAVFYGLESLVLSSHRQPIERAASQEKEGAANQGIFWIHISSFALYNALIGYLLAHHGGHEASGLFFYAVAMAMHFLVNDYGLRHHHKDAYRRVGRWVLATAILLGWIMAQVTSISEVAIATLFAFLAGGVVLNVLKEELPEERQSRFLPFLSGAAAYAVLLLL